MSPEERVEKTTKMIVRKLIYDDTKLIKSDQIIFDTILKTVEMVHKTPSGSESYEERIYQELLIYIKHCNDSATKPQPDIWLTELHETLMNKLERRVGWLSFINQIFITQCVLRVVDNHCRDQLLGFTFDSEFRLLLRYHFEETISKYLVEHYTSFILGLGGWSDLHDYFRAHSKTATLNLKLYTIPAMTLICIFVIFFYK